jgi:hypothetical protein
MDSAVRWLRASYIVGAVADALIGILTLLPERMGETEFRYPMGLAATLMFGWTVLLLWAYREPMERKGVLVITIFVIVGLLASGIWAVAAGHFPIQTIAPLAILGTALIVLMAFSYQKATIFVRHGS